MKKIIAGCAVAGILAAGSPSGAAWAGGRRALVVLSQRGFQEKEFFPVRDTLLSAGISFSVASSAPGEAVSVYGTKTACDKGLSGVNASEYDAVVFIGQEAEGQGELVDELAVRTGGVGGNAQDFDARGSEFVEGVAEPARLLGAPRGIILRVEVKSDDLAFEIRQLDGFAVGSRSGEGRRFGAGCRIRFCLAC